MEDIAQNDWGAMGKSGRRREDRKVSNRKGTGLQKKDLSRGGQD